MLPHSTQKITLSQIIVIIIIRFVKHQNDRISSFYVKLLTEKRKKQTEKQTGKRWVNDLLGKDITTTKTYIHRYIDTYIHTYYILFHTGCGRK